MPLDPSAMLVFATLARVGGVRGAAQALGVPRSTVSRRLATLEEEVGAPLVVRTARRFVLTEVGVALAEECGRLEELLARSDDIVRRTSSEPQGTLRIAAPPILADDVLPPVIAEMSRRYPRLSVDMRVSVDYVDLRKGNIDVALRASEVEDATDLYAVRLGTSEHVCLANPAYLEARGVPTTLADLAKHDCIGVGASPRVTWRFQVGSREQRLEIAGRHRVDSLRTAYALAIAGAGIVRGPRRAADREIAEGRLVVLLERYTIRPPVNAIHAGPNPPVPKVRVFIDLARVAVAAAFA